MSKDSLGDRMKGNYESRSKTYLTRRQPVILRLDGKAFHTFTRGCRKPFDDKIIDCMAITAQFLVDGIQGARLSYTQSDEISILVCDYDRLESGAWFDFNVQKMCSVAASMATAIFNDVYKGNSLAMFDCRAFNIPKEEVTNCFLWRYLDWSRNSTSMAAQSMFSHKELQGKNVTQMEEMIASKGWRWEQYRKCYRHGTFYGPSKYFQSGEGGCDFSVDLRNNRAWIDHAVDWTWEAEVARQLVYEKMKKAAEHANKTGLY